MTRPIVLRTDAEPWQKVHPSVRNQVSIMRYFGIRDWMMETDLASVIEMWWHCQALKADKVESGK